MIRSIFAALFTGRAELRQDLADLEGALALCKSNAARQADEIRRAYDSRDDYADRAHRAAEARDAFSAAAADLARQLAQACKERDELKAEIIKETGDWAQRHWRSVTIFEAIASAGAASKNGTARKLARMAREALE